jgi:hypothetical protein
MYIAVISTGHLRNGIDDITGFLSRKFFTDLLEISTLEINGSRETVAPGGALTKSYWLPQTTAFLAVRLIDLFGALLFCLFLHKGRENLNTVPSF